MNLEKRLDSHKWNAAFYDDADEINRVLSKHDIPRKQIKAIHPIGIAKELCSGMGYFLLEHELREQGSPSGQIACIDLATRKYPQLEQTMIRCEITLEEPLIVVFDDDTTMEMLPYKGKGLRLSFNQFPKEMEDGTNDSNIDAQKLFGVLSGTSILGLMLWQDTQEKMGRSGQKNTTRSYQLICRGSFGFTLTEIAGNEFKLQLTNQRCNSEHSRNVSARVSFADYMASAKPIKQIALYASDGHSAGFSLMPTQWDREKDWTPDWAAGCHNEMLTLWDDDAYSYLLYFFAKHCSSDFPDWIWGDWDDHDDSDEDIIYNRVISYELMEIIIADIRSVIHLLKTDYDHPNLAGIKAMFDPYSFDRMYVYKNPTPENDEIIRNNVDVVIHFYERFCWLAENMMQNAPQYRFISIWGD